jgi:hypothetical protein
MEGKKSGKVCGVKKKKKKKKKAVELEVLTAGQLKSQVLWVLRCVGS